MERGNYWAEEMGKLVQRCFMGREVNTSVIVNRDCREGNFSLFRFRIEMGLMKEGDWH